MRALLGGLLVVAAVAFSHRSPAVSDGAGEGNGRGCPVAGAAQFCDAATGLSTALRDPLLRMDYRSILPPPETPGAVDAAVTQATIDATICRPGYARAVRPPLAKTAPFKSHLMEAQHPGELMADYELDHLIPISLGGAPFDKRDLWLQFRRSRANASDKNVLAYVLWRLVCERRLPLTTAQQAISHDWTQAYATYATPENVRKYHFRPSGPAQD